MTPAIPFIANDQCYAKLLIQQSLASTVIYFLFLKIKQHFRNFKNGFIFFNYN